jgi:hypothetical protein
MHTVWSSQLFKKKYPQFVQIEKYFFFFIKWKAAYIVSRHKKAEVDDEGDDRRFIRTPLGLFAR